MIILFENNVKNIRMKTILEMMSLHCVPYILYWIQAERKFYIQTYCQIISVNFTNMVAIIFFKADVHIWLTIPSPCPHLSTFAWSLSPPPPNVRTSFMDGPRYSGVFRCSVFRRSWFCSVPLFTGRLLC